MTFLTNSYIARIIQVAIPVVLLTVYYIILKTLGSLNDKEKFCKSYDPLIKCMLDMIGTVRALKY